MNWRKSSPPDWYLFCQALGDGRGYPKSKQDQNALGFSDEDLQKLHDELIQNHDKELTYREKQMILKCVDGALNYVDTDIPSLYEISKAELKEFKENLEKRWNMHPTFL